MARPPRLLPSACCSAATGRPKHDRCGHHLASSAKKRRHRESGDVSHKMRVTNHQVWGSYFWFELSRNIWIFMEKWWFFCVIYDYLAINTWDFNFKYGFSTAILFVSMGMCRCVPLCAMVKCHRSIRCGPKKNWPVGTSLGLRGSIPAGLFFLAIQNMVKNGVRIVMIILVVFDPTFGRKTMRKEAMMPPTQWQMSWLHHWYPHILLRETPNWMAFHHRKGRTRQNWWINQPTSGVKPMVMR